MSIKWVAIAVMGACLASPAVLAQGGPATGAGAAPSGSVGGTVSGAPPEKTGSTTGIGQTKPPGDAVGDRLGTRPDLEEKSKQIDRRIDKGICTGCK